MVNFLSNCEQLGFERAIFARDPDRTGARNDTHTLVHTVPERLVKQSKKLSGIQCEHSVKCSSQANHSYKILKMLIAYRFRIVMRAKSPCVKFENPNNFKIFSSADLRTILERLYRFAIQISVNRLSWFISTYN